MPFSIATEPDERLLFAEQLEPPAKKADPFALALSDRAIFLPRKKTFAVSDPYYLERVPLSQVRGVTLRRYRPVWLLSLAGLFVVLGLVLLLEIFSRPRDLHDAKAIGYSAAMVIVGFTIPFVSRNRRALTIDLVSRRFRWAPQITVGGPYFSASQMFLRDFTLAARQAGVLVEHDLAPDA